MHRRGLYDPIEKEPVLRSPRLRETLATVAMFWLIRTEIMQSSHKNRRAWRLRSESETLDTSLQNPFHICDRDPVICHRNLLVGGTP